MKMKIINTVIEKTYDYFGEFYRDYICDFYTRFYEILTRKYSSCIQVTEYLMEEQLHDICTSYFHVSARTLMYELYRKRDAGELSGVTSRDRYISFINLLRTEEYKGYLKKQYPVLHRWLVTLTNSRIKLIEECLGHYEEDLVNIKEIFGFDDYMVKSLKITNGDSHNGGKKVILIETGSDKILYKPHDLSSEELFNRIIGIINSDSNVKYKLPMVKSISKNDYSWQEFINPEESESEKNIDIYYYKIGVYLGVLNMLSCEDIHRENIIAHNDTPVIIDMETLTNSKVKILDENTTLIERVLNENVQSVLGTMLLPTNSTFSVFDYDIGGVSGNENIETSKWEGFAFQDAGTDRIRFVKVQKFISNKSDNILKYNGEDTLARLYHRVIIKGFEDCYTAINIVKDQIIKTLKESDAKIRQVVRPTAVYTKFLEAATYPEYLMNEKKYETLLEKLYYSENDTAKLQTDYEILAMENGDVPYFYNTVNSSSLFSIYGEINDFFEYTIYDIIVNNLDKMSKLDRNKQVYYINLALSTQKNTSEKGALYHLKGGENNRDGMGIVMTIADIIAEKLVWDKDKDKCFVLTNLTVAEQRKYTIMDSSIYYCGGIILFYLALYKITKQEQYKKIAKGMLDAEVELKIGENLVDIGLFSGMGSLVYLYFESYCILEDSKYLQMMDTWLDKIDEVCGVTDEVDLSTGLSGTLILLLEIYEKERNEKCLQLAKKMAERLMIVLNEKNYSMNTGLAHGYSGVAWALYKIGHCVKNEKYIDAAIKCINKENEFFSESINNWMDLRARKANELYWCYGACGIGISRLKMNEICSRDILKKDMDRCRSIFVECDKHNLPQNHSLCHGLTGDIFVLDLYQKYYKDDSALGDKYKTLYQNLIDDLNVNGVLWGDKEIIEDYTFMLGLSGIGYELLRLTNDNLPSVLNVEI